jgi:steroid delta-isomerase-like uncharacterized protein
MTVENTRAAIDKYINSGHSDLSMMAEDVVFTNMATGDEHRGREGVRQMLNYIYHVAFDADAEVKNAIFADGKAVVEFDFIGKHIGEFAGIPASGQSVRVPLCVVYDLPQGMITRGRVYFEVPALLKQLGR